MSEEKTYEQWEINVKEQIAATDEQLLLDLAQDLAIHLAANLGRARVTSREMDTTGEDVADLIRTHVGKVAVILDVLQIRYGDCSDEELEFLRNIEGCLEE